MSASWGYRTRSDRALRLAPLFSPPDGPLTHFASPRGKKSGLKTRKGLFLNAAKLNACDTLRLAVQLRAQECSGAFGRFFQGGQAEIGGIHRLDGGTSPAGILLCLSALFASGLVLPFFKAREFFLTFLELSI